MKLIINCSGGIAGDMFTAALISAGADFESTRKNMLLIAEKLGQASINKNITADGSTQLKINLENNDFHLSGKKAEKLLKEILDTIKFEKIYEDFALRILDILINAEKKAHKENIFSEMNHTHHHHHHDDAILHEAQDIVVDIIGAVSGLRDLNVIPEAVLTGPVKTGGGKVTFSHGTLDIPAPATKVILDDFKINWEKGPIDHEICTPTGAAILAAIKVDDEIPAGYDIKSGRTGISRGSKILDIPPLKIYIPK
ncbi:MAG: nickel insertion protein [Acidobacteriota bacterium]